MLRMLAATAIAASLSGTAFAGTTFTAKLSQPFQTKKEIVAAKALWDCTADTCIATLERQKVSVSTCKKVVERIGPLDAFSNDRKALSKSDLARCNAVMDS